MADQYGNESEYEKIIEKISEIESSVKRPDVNIVDISGTFRNTAKRQGISYQDSLNHINKIEGHGLETISQIGKQQKSVYKPTAKGEQQLQQQQQQAAIAVQIQPQIEVAQQIQEVKEEEKAKVSQKESAKKELEELTRSLNVPKSIIKNARLKPVNEKDLVLPNLSINDQVAELERIVDGLKGNMFNGQDLDIVIQEVYGLSKVVDMEKKELKRSKRNVQENEYNLWILRDERLSDAVSILEENNR